MNRVTKIYSIVAGGRRQAIGARKADAAARPVAAGRPQMTIESPYIHYINESA